MRHLSIVCLLVVSSVLWQHKSTPATPDLPVERQAPTLQDKDSDKDEKTELPESASKIAPDDAVITIQGLCTPRSAPTVKDSHPTCQTRVSRSQFEQLAGAILPNKQAARQRQFATAYPNLLAMAQAAAGRGLEKSPRVQQRIAFARLQILSQELVRKIDDDAGSIPKNEIDNYYHNHSAEFETVSLERIYIPNHKPAVASALPEVAINRLAESVRGRAVAGENFVTLQKETYTTLEMTDAPPSSSLGQLRPSAIPPGHALAFDLKIGEVSKVISDPTGYYIYKLDSKQPEPIEKATEEIQSILKRERRDQAIQSIQQPVTTKLNPAYFGPTATE